MTTIKKMIKKAKDILLPIPPPNILFMESAPNPKAPKGVRLNGCWYPSRKEAIRQSSKQYRKTHDIPKAEKKDVKTIVFEQGKPTQKQQRMAELQSQGFSSTDALFKTMAEEAEARGDTAAAANHLKKLSIHHTPQPPQDDDDPVFSEDEWLDKHFGFNKAGSLNPNKGH